MQYIIYSPFIYTNRSSYCGRAFTSFVLFYYLLLNSLVCFFMTPSMLYLASAFSNNVAYSVPTDTELGAKNGLVLAGLVPRYYPPATKTGLF